MHKGEKEKHMSEDDTQQGLSWGERWRQGEQPFHPVAKTISETERELLREIFRPLEEYIGGVKSLLGISVVVTNYQMRVDKVLPGKFRVAIVYSPGEPKEMGFFNVAKNLRLAVVQW